MNDASGEVTGSEPMGGATGQLAPVSERERIISLDVLRGMAILGIFFVNIAFFAGSMTMMMNPALLADQPLSEQLAWIFVKVFAEFKFISLFSLLFGIGLVVQFNRARQRGGELGVTYIRRLLILLLIGLIHGLLIWYGDILFMYAVGGFVLFLFRGVNASVLAIVAVICLLLGGAFHSGISALGVAAEVIQERERETGSNVEQQPEQVPAEQPLQIASNSDDRWERWKDAIKRWGESGFNVLDESWHEAETIAYKEGPMLATIYTRAIGFAGHVFMAGLFGGFGLRILGMFLLGAALMKWNFFDASRRKLHLHLFIWGLGLGLLLEGLVAWLYYAADFQLSWSTFFADSLHYFSSLVLMFGYIGCVCTLVHAGALRWLQTAIGAVGRMALTNYLLQSVVASFIMYWYGLALFGEFSRVQQLMLVMGIYLSQIILSLIWLRLFRFGPMEWLWRSLAYWKPQPLTRGS